MSKNCETCSLFDSIMLGPIQPASTRNTTGLYPKLQLPVIIC